MPFTVVAQPGTDLWRKPPSTDRDNAPSHSIHPKIPLSSFKRARVEFSGPWTTRYDQGGLVLKLEKKGQQTRWFKAGIEYYLDRPYIASVACDAYADWALAPSASPESKTTVIEIRREADEMGPSLWLYQLVMSADVKKEEQRVPLREVTWLFADPQGWTVEIAAMAARPAQAEEIKGDDKELVVTFENTEVEVEQ